MIFDKDKNNSMEKGSSFRNKWCYNWMMSVLKNDFKHIVFFMKINSKRIIHLNLKHKAVKCQEEQ